ALVESGRHTQLPDCENGRKDRAHCRFGPCCEIRRRKGSRRRCVDARAISRWRAAARIYSAGAGARAAIDAAGAAAEFSADDLEDAVEQSEQPLLQFIFQRRAETGDTTRR